MESQISIAPYIRLEGIKYIDIKLPPFDNQLVEVRNYDSVLLNTKVDFSTDDWPSEVIEAANMLKSVYGGEVVEYKFREHKFELCLITENDVATINRKYTSLPTEFKIEEYEQPLYKKREKGEKFSSMWK